MHCEKTDIKPNQVKKKNNQKQHQTNQKKNPPPPPAPKKTQINSHQINEHEKWEAKDKIASLRNPQVTECFINIEKIKMIMGKKKKQKEERRRRRRRNHHPFSLPPLSPTADQRHIINTNHAREGDRLTSSTHGLRVSSTSMSKPYSSATLKKTQTSHHWNQK